jgi:hypothetical protein
VFFCRERGHGKASYISSWHKPPVISIDAVNQNDFSGDSLKSLPLNEAAANGKEKNHTADNVIRRGASQTRPPSRTGGALWIALLAGLVLLEKLLPWGQKIGRIAGAVMLLSGILLIAL